MDNKEDKEIQEFEHWGEKHNVSINMKNEDYCLPLNEWLRIIEKECANININSYFENISTFEQIYEKCGKIIKLFKEHNETWQKIHQTAQETQDLIIPIIYPSNAEKEIKENWKSMTQPAQDIKQTAQDIMKYVNQDQDSPEAKKTLAKFEERYYQGKSIIPMIYKIGDKCKSFHETLPPDRSGHLSYVRKLPEGGYCACTKKKKCENGVDPMTHLYVVEVRED
jgi:hypothetical protein